jgi:sec-independent protein translocase protein TatA
MGFGIKELVVLLVIVALVFGTKKIKGVGSDVGGWIRDFKKAMKEEPKESDPLEGDAQTIEAEVSSEKEEGAPR